MEIELAGGLNENPRSLWKICRALANPLRLELMRIVYTSGGDNYENQIVKMVEVRQAIVSAYLNMLVGAGLIGVERDCIKVYFKPWPRHRGTGELCRVLNDHFIGCDEGWQREIIRRVRPFSHFNRLAILGRLMNGPATKDELRESTGTIVKTLDHHLRIINAAGMLRKTFHGPNPMTLELVHECNPLTEVLLMYLQEEIANGEDFVNLVKDRGMDKESSWVCRNIRNYEGEGWTGPVPERPKSAYMDDETATAINEPNLD